MPGPIGQDGGVTSLVSATAALLVARPGGLRLVVPAQDEDVAMMATQLSRFGDTGSLPQFRVRRGTRDDRRGASVLACPVCFGAEETSMIDGAKLGVVVMLAITARGAGRVRWLLSLSPQAREAHGGCRARQRMVGAPKVAENIMTDWLGLPPLASTHGGQIDGMIGWVHVFMFILFVGWGGFFAYCLVRFRRSRHPVANYTGVKSHTSSYLEVGVAVVEAILLFGFAIPLWAARVDRMPSAKRSAGRAGHRRAVRLERPLSRPRRRLRPHRAEAHRPR